MANTSWNGSDKTANITLSGSNLVATTTSNGIGSVRAADRQGSGKFYWEYTVTTGTSALALGVANGAFSLSTFAAGSSGSGATVVSNNGNVWFNGTQVLTGLGTVNTGVLICIALNLDNGLIWFRSGAAGNWNASAAADPAGLIGGLNIGPPQTYYPVLSFQANTQVVTANFGDTAFTGTAPSGFTGGFTSGASPALLGVVTQNFIEEWADGNPAAQATQVFIEQWAAPTGTLLGLVSQMFIEEWASSSAPSGPMVSTIGFG